MDEIGSWRQGARASPLLPPPSPGSCCPPSQDVPRGPAPPRPVSRPRPHLAGELSPLPAPGVLGRTVAIRGHLAAHACGTPPGLRARGARAPARGRPRRAPVAGRQKAGVGPVTALPLSRTVNWRRRRSCSTRIGQPCSSAPTGTAAVECAICARAGGRLDPGLTPARRAREYGEVREFAAAGARRCGADGRGSRRAGARGGREPAPERPQATALKLTLGGGCNKKGGGRKSAVRSRAERSQWARGLFVLIHSIPLLKEPRASPAAFQLKFQTKQRTPHPSRGHFSVLHLTHSQLWDSHRDPFSKRCNNL